MRRIRLIIVAGLMAATLALGTVGTTSAHTAGPCNDSGEPGHSDYAQHHIVAHAHEQTLGAHGHVPGSHKGYSACNPSGK